MTGEGDATLLASFRAGDRGAFREIVHRHGPELLAYVSRLTGDPAWAEDLVQEVFLRLFERARTLRDGERLRPWLYAVARNAALDFVKRRRLDPRLAAPEVDAVPGRDPSPDGALEERELHERVARALDQVPEPFRAPFELCVVRGLSYEDAARVLGIPVKTLSSRLFRARERFRECLEERRP